MFGQVGIGVEASSYGKVVMRGRRGLPNSRQAGLLNCIVGVAANTAQSMLRGSGRPTRFALCTVDSNVRTYVGR